MINHIQTSEKFGIKFGGVWKDFHESIKEAEEKKSQAEEILNKVVAQRDCLQSEKDELLNKFRENMASLTDSETHNMEAKQIIERIKHEKQDLISRCLSLDTQREWLESQNKQYKMENIELKASLAQSTERLQCVEQQLAEERKETKTLSEIVYTRDEGIESWQAKLRGKQTELDVLSKSLATKDKQFQALLRERNRLKDELEAAQKQVRKYVNLSVHKWVEEEEEQSRRSTPLHKRSTTPVSAGKMAGKDIAASPDQNVDTINVSAATPVKEAEAANLYDSLYVDIAPPASAVSAGDNNQHQESPQVTRETNVDSDPSVASEGTVKANPWTPSKKQQQVLSGSGAPSFSLRERLHSAQIAQYAEQLQLARDEVNRLRKALGDKHVLRQQRAKKTKQPQVQQTPHQLFITPTKMTRRVDTPTAHGSTPCTVTAGTAEKSKKSPMSRAATPSKLHMRDEQRQSSSTNNVFSGGVAANSSMRDVDCRVSSGANRGSPVVAVVVRHVR